MNNCIKTIWNNKKYRDISILTLLIFILICLILYRIMNAEKPPPEGAIRVVVCTKCAATYATRIKDIDDPKDKRNRCKKCGGKLAIAWKCDECKFEYPEFQLGSIKNNLKTTMDKYRAVVESRRCPNCGSLSAHPMSVNELERKHNIESKEK